MDFLSIINIIKDKIPQPLEYLKNVIRVDTPERTNAFLAVSAGLILIVGFMFVVIAMTIYEKKLTTEFVTICGAIVTLATLNRVDGKPPQPKLPNG